ncbi:putative protein kinase UbiB [Halomonas elongata]|uniref:ABC1 atypical kinase-like domain-containing protein n=1 Tax=Halomonas elongata TaxID=2746 RepID=A0A1B8P3G3_HALEL|nr:putative protein kinase UbiB [Halomonas elongata]
MRERGRRRRLLGLGSRTGGALLKHRLGGQADWRALGEALFEGLSELKGPAMKLAQIMAQWDDLLPADLADELARLQRQAEPMPWDDIRRTLEDCYGDPATYFASIEQRPFASASMGQVHRASTHDGETVVLKVQYPGLAEVLEDDLRQVHRLMRLGRWLRMPQARLDALFEELAASLRGELDYRAEAEALARYRARYAQRDDLVIPEPLPALCGPACWPCGMCPAHRCASWKAPMTPRDNVLVRPWPIGSPRSSSPTENCMPIPTPAISPPMPRGAW